MFRWTPEMVRFMQNATEFGTYHQELAGHLLPALSKESRIADVGCGTGGLSLALAPHVGQVTAIDSSAAALAALQQERDRRGLSNIQIFQGDALALPPDACFDAMVFCFFGRIEEILAVAAGRCSGTIFAFKRNYRTHRFSTGSPAAGDDSYENALAFLNANGIPFESSTFSLEFGQPFTSFEEAKQFFELYNRGPEPVTDAFVTGKLQTTGRSDYPLYLPQRREIGFLTLHASDLPKIYIHE